MTKRDKPVVELVGRDGNAVAIMVACRRAARKAGWPRERIDAILAEMKAGDYRHLLETAQDYFEVV